VNSDWQSQPVAVLCSGGPDSAVLTAELARTSPRVVPLYVRLGMFWDREEETALRQFLAALRLPSLADPVIFNLPLNEVYGRHWSTTGDAVPNGASPDSAVELPGRNLLVLAQPAVWCHLHQVPTLALALLRGNPFPDGRDEFFDAYSRAINLAVDGRLQVVRPYSQLTKAEVLQRGRDLPLELTWSCMRPVQGLHCGDCNKCAERQRAFARAGLVDPTRYAV
jgi:7-cyano-7-deazaguanine synthase